MNISKFFKTFFDVLSSIDPDAYEKQIQKEIRDYPISDEQRKSLGMEAYNFKRYMVEKNRDKTGRFDAPR